MEPFYRTLNPSTGELVRYYPLAADFEVETQIANSSNAFEDWRRRSVAERVAPLNAVAELLDAEADALAELMAIEMGKPLGEGRAEAKKSAAGCRWYADNGEALLADDPRESDGSSAFVRYDPLGPVLAIMPWNFPFWQFFRFAAPGLTAGNTAVLKHSPNTPACALKIVSLMLEAGYPDGVVCSLFLDNGQAARVIRDTRLRGVTLTGSTAAGSTVAGLTGTALKPMVMELGGSDPFIVFDDADIDVAASTAATARCQNSGQSCIASKRFLVQKRCVDEFTERFVSAMTSRVVGDPLEPGTQIGPLAREDLRERLAEQVASTLDSGARALCGGTAPERPGFFYTPTVLADVPGGTAGADEELFGPVATLIEFETEAEAIAVANRTRYGLGASLWTRDPGRAERMVPDIESGNVFVNGMVRSDPRLPFGGVKASGFGRELAREGILSFVNAKTVWIA